MKQSMKFMNAKMGMPIPSQEKTATPQGSALTEKEHGPVPQPSVRRLPKVATELKRQKTSPAKRFSKR